MFGIKQKTILLSSRLSRHLLYYYFLSFCLVKFSSNSFNKILIDNNVCEMSQAGYGNKEGFLIIVVYWETDELIG